MATLDPADLATWLVTAAAVGGVVRPFGWPEAAWAVGGAATLVALGLLPPSAAWAGVARGGDVTAFLLGMMLLAAVARREGLFDWLAGFAVRGARGSASRLFGLVYGVGVLATAVLSNDATAVVLTPAVAAAARAAGVGPLPYLLACAFVANAASFVLPVANPANLVVFAGGVPPLGPWLARFAVPSALAIAATFAALRWTQRAALRGAAGPGPGATRLSPGGAIAGLGIAATGAVLAAASALDAPLGAPTLGAGLATTACVLLARREAPWPTLKGVDWAVIPLVAGLFALVEACERTGVLAVAAAALRRLAAGSDARAASVAGVGVALATNLANNLPVGLFAGAAVADAHLSERVADAILVGVDLGPNLSVTGSLATILWLAAIRREGERVGAWVFLRLGLVVMPPALLAALAGLALER